MVVAGPLQLAAEMPDGETPDPTKGLVLQLTDLAPGAAAPHQMNIVATLR